MKTDEILDEREGQYGDYWTQATYAQYLKLHVRRGKNYNRMPAPMKESLEMIATKISRLMNGDYEKTDTWADIAGYAQLVVKELENG